MGFETERLAIVSKFDAEWAAWAGRPKVVYDNMRFTPTPGETYLRLSVQNTGSRVAGYGTTPTYRWYGIVLIAVFVPENTGSKTALEWLDEAAAIFRNTQVADITFNASYQPSVEMLVNGWYKRTIAIPFWRDGAN